VLPKIELLTVVGAGFLDPEGLSQNATLVVVVVVSSVRVKKCLRLSYYAAEHNETLHTHLC